MVFAIVIYYYTISTGTNLDLSGTTNVLLIIAISLVGLAILYNLLVSYLSKLKGWPGFIAELIFYLPCVLYDLWSYLLEQFKLTPIAIYGFILIEIILKPSFFSTFLTFKHMQKPLFCLFSLRLFSTKINFLLMSFENCSAFEISLRSELLKLILTP